MKKHEKVKYLIIGMVTMLFITTLANPVFTVVASFIQKDIRVNTGVNIYIDDEKLIPRDGTGKIVDAFIYDGTTYLPARAISEAIGKPVQWDGSTFSVYIGRHNSSTPAVMLGDLDYFDGTSTWSKATLIKDNMGKVYDEVLIPYKSSSSTDNSTTYRTYKLNGQYSRMIGTFFKQYDYRSNSNKITLEIYGDGKLLFTTEVHNGIEPVNFNIDLTGVLELKISLVGYTASTAFGNCGLYY